MATLGISTNTRLVSGAIISQNQLIDFFTHLHKSSWSPAKAVEIVASLEPCVRQYCINSVVLSIPHVYHQTKAHSSLMEAFKAYFRKKEITVYTKTPEAFTAFCKVGERKRKKEMMRTVAEQFPELTRCYQKELRNKNKYYYKLFEAVALASLVEQEGT